MIRQNLHTHTVFDDGKNTPMEMARAALGAGLRSLGFSCHSVLPYPNDWSLTDERLPAYLDAVAEAGAAFAGRLQIFSGVEWDALSPQDTAGFDYVIGSLHHIAADGSFPSVDESPAVTRALIEERFGGSADAMARAYYAQYEALAAAPDVDIVGHFDLITKFDERHGFFDTGSAAYRAASMEALDALCRADKLFEVNTGAMSRGWRTSPYPAPPLLRALRERGARVVISSDAHSAGAVAHAFPETETMLRELGFRERWELRAEGFAPVPL